VRINFRLLFLTLLAVLIGGGGVVGALWWRGRPDYLYESAQKYYEKGESLQNSGQLQVAKEYYAWANQRLEQLLDKDKKPSWPPAQLLKHKVLFRWAGILAQEEQDQGKVREPGTMLPSDEMATKAKEQAFLAARDKDLYEAQAIALDEKFKEDDLFGAIPYATNVLKISKDRRDQVTNVNHILGAHFVLASQYMTGSSVNPDLALQQVDEAASLVRSQGQGALPKWRMVDIEMRALKAKIDKAKAATKGPVPVTKPKTDPATDGLVKTFQDKIQENLARVRQEMTETVPGSKEGEPARKKLGQLSHTDIRGLLDFLGLAMKESADKSQVLDRAELVTELGRMMTEKDVEPRVAKETTKFLAIVPQGLASLDDKIRPTGNELKPIYASVEEITKKMVDAGVYIEPRTYRQMAETEYREGRYKDALEYAKLGLETARRLKAPAKDPEYLRLNYVAAWVLLLQKQTNQAEEYLQPLRDNAQLAATAHLIEGVAAVWDNRLEVGLKHLLEAQKSPQLKDNLYSSLGTGYAYLGLGKYEDALAAFTRVDEYLKKPEKLTLQDKEILKMLRANQDNLNYDIFRCHVYLRQLDKAREYQEKLKTSGSRFARNADLMMIGAALNTATALRGTGKEAEARQVYAEAGKMIADAKKLYGEIPDLTSHEINMLLNDPAAPGAPGLLFGGAVNIDWMMRVARVEKYLTGLVESKKDFNSKFVWARWLETTGRVEEADKVLLELEQTGLDSGQRRAVALERSKLALARRQPGDYKDVIAKSTLSDADKKLEMLRLEIQGQNFNVAENLIGTLKDDRERMAEVQFLQGVVAQGQGKFQDAVWDFERAMQFIQFKGRAQNGLLASLLGLAEKSTPAVAQETVNKLLRTHADDPAVLMAAAEIERLQDNLEGMKDRLASLKAVLDKEKPDNPAGAYVAATTWNKAGRPDMARREIEAAIRSANKKHLPSVLLAGQLAAQDEDWDALLIHAAELDEIQPELLDSYLWKAAANRGLGKKDEARKIYETLKIKAPRFAAGYTGLAGLHEQAKQYDEALKIIREWRKVAPYDAAALRTEVRLLALSGKPEEAEKVGDESIKAMLKKADEAYEEGLKKDPPKDDKDKENRAKSQAEGKLKLEMDGLLTVAGGLQDAKQHPRARPWYDRALKVAEKRPEAVRADETLGIQILLAENYLQDGINAKSDKARHDAAMSEAFKIYQELYKTRPDNLVVANNLAWMLDKEKNDPKGAMAIIDKVRKGRFSQKPVTGDRLPLEMLDTLGVILLSNNDNEGAMSLYKEASARYGSEPRVFLNLGRAYLGLGQKKEAFENLTKGIQLANSKMERAQDDGQKEKLKEIISEAQKDLAKVQ
jgi:predicted Zn-dependent protease